MIALLIHLAAAPTAKAPAVSIPSPSSRARFSARAFAKPDSFHWPGHMWIWNDRLDPEEVKRQLADMAAHGALSPMPLPEPKDFRPTNMPTRMEPGYLTPEFFGTVRVVADEASRLGLRLWLYDEGGWPSGNACGQLVRAHPELGRQSLRREVRALAEGQVVGAPESCLASFIDEPDGSYARLSPEDRIQIRGPGRRQVTFSVTRHGWHADLMNPAATDAFIAMTHEGYRKAAGKHFGSAIPAIFTDEPYMGDMPWTEGFAEAFMRDKGYDLRLHLPALYEGEGREAEQARIDYFDWWSRRFADAYFGRCRDWCRRSGILFSGHLNGEDETMGARKYGFGHAMRMMRQMDTPGVDAIWRQIWPGKRNHHFPKFASSVAHQQGTDWAITESYAVYGSGLTPEQMKWILDYQFVRGINLLDMIGYPYSTADWMIAGERPNYHPRNPLWDALKDFHAYAARLSYLMALGKPRITTALHFPIRDIWAGGRNAEAVAVAHDAAAQALFERQCDFDLVDDDAIIAEGSFVRDGRLHVGAMAYDTVVVTRQAWMDDAARRRLEEFAAAGGRVLALDVSETGSVPMGATRVSLADLSERLKPTVAADRACPSLRVCVRDTGSGSLYFLTNEGQEPLDVTLFFREKAPCVRLDPESGRAYRLDGIVADGEGSRARLRLPHAGSVVLLFGSGARAAEPAPEAAERPTVLAEGWTLSVVRSFELTDTDIQVRRVPQPPSEGQRHPLTALGDWSRLLGEAFSGEAVYECRFAASATMARDAAWLDLGEVRYACRVEINDKDVGRRLWRPWRVPVRGKVRAGENIVRVYVTNTLANQYIHNRAYERWTPAQLGPYHPRALEFERDSLSSGLFGPVRLLGTDGSGGA